MKIPLLATVIITALLAGCDNTPRETKAGFSGGYYTMTKGGFNEGLSINFSNDGSYVLRHVLFLCVIGADGEMPTMFSEETGSWKIENSIVILTPKTRTKDFPDESTFAPAWVRRLVFGEKDTFLSADSPEKVVLKKGTPNAMGWPSIGDSADDGWTATDKQRR